MPRGGRRAGIQTRSGVLQGDNLTLYMIHGRARRAAARIFIAYLQLQAARDHAAAPAPVILGGRPSAEHMLYSRMRTHVVVDELVPVLDLRGQRERCKARGSMD